MTVSRVRSAGMALLLVAAVFARHGALAADERSALEAGLDARYPAGSIGSRAGAEGALAEAAKIDTAAQLRYDAERAECLKAFLVNHCLDGARRRLMLSRRVVARVQVEAHDWERSDDAAKREAERVEQARERESQQPERDQHERASKQAADQRVAGASQHHADVAKQAVDGASKRARFEQRQAEHAADQAKLASPANAALRADNVRESSEKRDLAEQHAKQVAEDRKTNEARREERKKSLAADEERRLHPPARPD